MEIRLAKKSILIRLDEELYDSLHKLMGYNLFSEDGILLDKMHHGSHQDWYRNVITRGINELKKEWDKKVKEYESQDDN
jgi:hypothetical protein